jgi:predicted  nucleic acid-binding Zn-ribbon protein
MQHDLFPHPVFSITPETGRNGPRLWVRRLVIWREPGTIIRSIELKPGLNIVWSPDPGSSETAPIGHGGGKTMFCRLLRYCLGEDGFAPESQRRSFLEKLPNGHVGAEIILDGRLWIVVRALAPRHRDIVVEGGSLDEAFWESVTPSGMDPLRDAVTKAIIGDAARLVPPSIGESRVWEAALAWATRDQECRFGHHLDWRDPNTDSHSPVRGRSMEDRLVVVRALLGALSSEEITTRQGEEDLTKALIEYRAELARLDWQIGRTRNGLGGALSGVGTEAGLGLDAAGFKAAAAQHITEVMKLPAERTTMDLESNRAGRDATRDEVRRLEAELNEVAIRIEEQEKTVTFMRSQLPEAHARMAKENNPICPICEVPIERALAEGCGISAATCDLGALQTRIEKMREEIDRAEIEIASIRAREPGLKISIALARQRLEPLERAVLALESALFDHSKAIRSAERLVEEAERYEALLSERTKVAASVGDMALKLESSRDTLAAHRASVGETIGRLSDMFDAVLQELVPGEIKGHATLDGNGLTLKVELGGVRSTAAIESLKVVAFDLAALAMTIEGRTRLAGIVVHDSPREADLGRSIYDRLFGFAGRLENFSRVPLFQYIVTTTSEPPAEFRSEPWLRLTLRGAPAEDRLLRVDL